MEDGGDSLDCRSTLFNIGNAALDKLGTVVDMGALPLTQIVEDPYLMARVE